jgi:hypothetical protein
MTEWGKEYWKPMEPRRLNGDEQAMILYDTRKQKRTQTC